MSQLEKEWDDLKTKNDSVKFDSDKAFYAGVLLALKNLHTLTTTEQADAWLDEIRSKLGVTIQ